MSFLVFYGNLVKNANACRDLSYNIHALYRRLEVIFTRLRNEKLFYLAKIIILQLKIIYFIERFYGRRARLVTYGILEKSI